MRHQLHFALALAIAANLASASNAAVANAPPTPLTNQELQSVNGQRLLWPNLLSKHKRHFLKPNPPWPANPPGGCIRRAGGRPGS